MLHHGQRRRIERRALLAAAGSTLAAPALVRAQAANVGVALVIGNSKYQWEAALPNVRRDAPDVAKRLQALGLKTELVQDAGRDSLLHAADRLRSGARGTGIAALYFAGHGVSWNKESYIVPVDADLGDPSAVQKLVDVTALSATTKEAAHRLLVFDSCRNNPADGWRQKEALTLAKVEAVDQLATAARQQNTLLLFSTAPGRTALDGPAGENSPFAASFLRQLDEPSVDLQKLPAQLRRDLLIATEGRQVVWAQSTFTAPFTLSGQGVRRAARINGDPSRILEIPKAYDFARQNGLPIPPGLIAYRPPGGSPHIDKIGAFKFDFKVPTGQSGGTYIQPSLVIVMSVAENNTAEIILLTKEWRSSNGAIARFSTATLSARGLEFLTTDEAVVFAINWRDRNSGSVAFKGGPASRGGASMMSSYMPFTRLDG